MRFVKYISRKFSKGTVILFPSLDTLSVRNACDIITPRAMASRPTSMRYTYTPCLHLLRQPEPPVLGYREPPPVYAPFLVSRPAHTATSHTRLRPESRWPAARVVPPPAFFLSPSDPGEQNRAAASALRSLAEAAFLSNGDTAIRTTTTTTAPRSRKRKGASGLTATPVKPKTAVRGGEGVDRENTFLALPPPTPRGDACSSPVPFKGPVRPLEELEYRELKNLFPKVFGKATTSNNKAWIYKRLKDHFDIHGDSRVTDTRRRKSGSTQKTDTKPLADATNDSSPPFFSAA